MKINWENIDLESQKIIKKTTDDFSNNLKIPEKSQVSYHFLKPSEIQTLNKTYRKIDKPTDVLSFPLWPNLKKIPPKINSLLGDIFICPEILKENAENYKVSYKQELAKITEHSLNHLIGRHHSD